MKLMFGAGLMDEDKEGEAVRSTFANFLSRLESMPSNNRARETALSSEKAA